MRQHGAMREPGCRTCAATHARRGLPDRCRGARIGVAEGTEVSAEARFAVDPYHPMIDVWLRDDLDAPRKQRHTAKRISDRLLDEHHAADLSYWMVREYVATRRQEIRIEPRTDGGLRPAGTPAWAGGRGGLR
jgi:hypothetical protein